MLLEDRVSTSKRNMPENIITAYSIYFYDKHQDVARKPNQICCLYANYIVLVATLRQNFPVLV
jgi:hypothetical protein